MIYQHATRDQDHAIAEALGTFVRDARGSKKTDPKRRNAPSKAHSNTEKVSDR
jgi:hypothetical protein